MTLTQHPAPTAPIPYVVTVVPNRPDGSEGPLTRELFEDYATAREHMDSLDFPDGWHASLRPASWSDADEDAAIEDILRSLDR